MKFSTLPPFKATGKVAIYQPGDFSPTTRLEVSIITNDAWSISSAMERAAKWKLEYLGAPKDKIDALIFEYSGTDELEAMETRGIKRVWGERVEAFFDDSSLTEKKRATLIRQRRLVPAELKDARAIYAKPAPAKQEEAVAA